MSREFQGRTDTVSQTIPAPPERVFRALLDPSELVAWLPPAGMRAQLLSFDARPGGGYRMVLTYADQAHATPGKTSEHADAVDVEFVEIVDRQRIVQLVRFQSADPAFARPMRMTWRLAEVRQGTEVTIAAEDVPAPISAEDHRQGMNSSLANLAAHLGRNP